MAISMLCQLLVQRKPDERHERLYVYLAEHHQTKLSKWMRQPHIFNCFIHNRCEITDKLLSDAIIHFFDPFAALPRFGCGGYYNVYELAICTFDLDLISMCWKKGDSRVISANFNNRFCSKYGHTPISYILYHYRESKDISKLNKIIYLFRVIGTISTRIYERILKEEVPALKYRHICTDCNIAATRVCKNNGNIVIPNVLGCMIKWGFPIQSNVTQPIQPQDDDTPCCRDVPENIRKLIHKYRYGKTADSLLSFKQELRELGKSRNYRYPISVLDAFKRHQFKYIIEE
jgi:hypothetical protein